MQSPCRAVTLVVITVLFLQLTRVLPGVRSPTPFNRLSPLLCHTGSHISSRALYGPWYLALEPVVPNGSLCKSHLFPGGCHSGCPNLEIPESESPFLKRWLKLETWRIRKPVAAKPRFCEADSVVRDQPKGSESF